MESRDIPPFLAPGLRFGFDALQPVIGQRALHAHHEKIHDSYLKAINGLLAGNPQFADQTIEDVLRTPDAIPPEIRDVVLDIGGAHANHQFFWKVIGPGGGAAPNGALADAINRDFGGFAELKAAFTAIALDLEGAGFAFLSLSAPKTDKLEVISLRRNRSVLSIGKPGILICDLWDHAWAEDHTDRKSWIDDFWSIVDWDVCERRYLALKQGRQPE